MGLSFKKSRCLKLNTKGIFKVNNTVNDPFSLINIIHMLQSLRYPVAPFPTMSLLETVLIKDGNIGAIRVIRDTVDLSSSLCLHWIDLLFEKSEWNSVDKGREIVRAL